MEYIFIALFLILVCISFRSTSKYDNKSFISFMETFNLTEMPIVTFFAGDTKINFLLDTGSTSSYISQNSSELITGSEEVCNMGVISAGGTDNLNCKVIDTFLSYNNIEYEVKLFVNKNLDESFSKIKDSKGITLHGILGSDFMDKYSYVIDFEKYVAYSKK